MTLVVAWTHLGAAFIAGDSALSHRGTAPITTSSFGELQLRDDGVAVEEMTPKVVRLAHDVLAGFSGDVQRAEQFMNITWRALARHPLVETVERLARATDPNGPEFRIVFAYVDRQAARLLVYSSRSGIERSNGPVYVLGSASDVLVAEARKRIAGLAAVGQLTDDMVITAALAHLQALGIHNWLPAQRIGGAFFGAYVRPGLGGTWQPPITYVLHPPYGLEGDTMRKLKTRGPDKAVSLIHTRVHHEAGIVFSSLLDDVLRILPSPWTGNRTAREWMQALMELYPDRLVITPDDATSHFTFIDVLRARALVLKRRPQSDFPIKIEDRNLLLSKDLVDVINRQCGEEFSLHLVVQPDA